MHISIFASDHGLFLWLWHIVSPLGLIIVLNLNLHLSRTLSKVARRGETNIYKPILSFHPFLPFPQTSL